MDKIPVTSAVSFANGYSVEISDTSAGFRHRIAAPKNLAGEIEKSAWTPYEFITVLHGFLHCTNYFADAVPTETLVRFEDVAAKNGATQAG